MTLDDAGSELLSMEHTLSIRVTRYRGPSVEDDTDMEDSFNPNSRHPREGSAPPGFDWATATPS